jgi:hypothetical protein
VGTDCDCQHARYARTQFTDPNLGQAESAEMLVKMRENYMRTGMIMMKRILLRKQHLGTLLTVEVEVKMLIHIES